MCSGVYATLYLNSDQSILPKNILYSACFRKEALTVFLMIDLFIWFFYFYITTTATSSFTRGIDIHGIGLGVGRLIELNRKYN